MSSAGQADLIGALHGALGGRVYLNAKLCTELGGWPEGTADHRIDAVVLPQHPSPGLVDHDDDPEEFNAAVRGADMYLAVARGYIDRPLLGMLLAATDLLSRSHPDHGLLRQAAAVHQIEPNIAWVYDRHGVRVVHA
jgi:hypothetical protein